MSLEEQGVCWEEGLKRGRLVLLEQNMMGEESGLDRWGQKMKDFLRCAKRS